RMARPHRKNASRATGGKEALPRGTKTAGRAAPRGNRQPLSTAARDLYSVGDRLGARDLPHAQVRSAPQIGRGAWSRSLDAASYHAAKSRGANQPEDFRPFLAAGTTCARMLGA